MHCRPSLFPRFLALAVAAGLLGWSSPAGGQVIRLHGGDDSIESQVDIFVTPDRLLLQHLNRAEEAVREERFGDAVEELARLLTEPDPSLADAVTLEQDYFIGRGRDGEPQTSVKTRANRLLGTMPPSGRQWYELRFGVHARRLLEDALSARDVGGIEQVTRNYLHTEAGYEATLLLGRYHLDHGRPLAAALCFRRIAESSSADRFEPDLSLLLATCWYAANMHEQAADTLRDLKSRFPDAQLKVAGAPVNLFATGSDPLRWLEDVMGARPGAPEDTATQWVVYRGNPQRNARSDGSFPLLNFRWQVPTANDPTDEELIAQRRQQYVTQGIAAIPGLHPLAVRDTVLMRTPQRLVAVSFETGKREWEFPWFESPDERSLRTQRRRPERRTASTRSAELAQRLWEDAAYGQMSSDGDLVFMITDLGYASESSSSAQVLIQPQGRAVGNPGWPKDHNKLVALSLAEQGKLRWIIGGETGEDEPDLAGAFFLGAPLALMDQLFVLVEMNGELRLVTLDGKTGQLQWSQQLAHVESMTIQVDGPRRLAAASPSFADGILVCPTSAGAVVALDVATRSLLWGFQYGNDYAPVPGFPVRSYPAQVKSLGDRWIDSTATIADGRVILTPIESDELFCFDLLDGEVHWRKNRGSLLYVAGVHNGSVILVGKNRVTALSLEDGEPAWAEPAMLDGAMPSGRGFLADGSYFLPTTASELLEVDLSDGSIAGRVRTDKVLGNLVCYGDQILSQNVDWLGAYYQSEPLREEVEDRLAANDDDEWALARRAELLLHDGQRHEAVVTLRRVLDLDPQDETVRALLVKTLLAALAEDFAGNRSVALELEGMIEDAEDRAEYMRLMAEGLHQDGELDRAFGFYLRLAQLDPPQRFMADPEHLPFVQVSPELSVRRDRWVQARLEELWHQADAAQQERIQNLLARELATAIEEAEFQGLEKLLEHLGRHPAAATGRLELARQYRSRNKLLEAESILVGLQASTTAAIAGEATAELGALYLELTRYHEAATCYDLLGSRFAELELENGDTGAERSRQVLALQPLQDVLGPPDAWPYGRHVIRDGSLAANRLPGYERVYPIPLSQARGPLRDDLRVVFNQQMNSLMIRDGNGAALQQVLLRDTNQFYARNYNAFEARAFGHLMLVSVGFEVLAIDTLRASNGQGNVILWRHDISNEMATPTGRQRQLSERKVDRRWIEPRYFSVDTAGRHIGQAGPINAAGAFFQKLGEITCADPISGDVYWRRGMVERGSDLFGDDDYLFVVGPDDDQALVLRTVDGQAVGERYAGSRAHRIWTRGRLVLEARPQDQMMEVHLFDAWSGEDLWSTAFPIDARATLVERDELAVLQRDGQFQILDIMTGSPRLTATLQPEPDLDRLIVMRSRQQYHVVAARPAVTSSARVNIHPVLTTGQCPLVDARIYAFDRTTGAAQWATPAEVPQHGLLLDQPSESPVLTFIRQISTNNSRTAPAASVQGSILCLDKRDGRVVLADDQIPVQIQSYEILANPARRQVAVMVTGRSFTIEFTDQPMPPSPPAQTPDLVRVLSHSSRGRLQQLGETLLDAFGRGDGQDGGNQPNPFPPDE